MRERIGSWMRWTWRSGVEGKLKAKNEVMGRRLYLPPLYCHCSKYNSGLGFNKAPIMAAIAVDSQKEWQELRRQYEDEEIARFLDVFRLVSGRAAPCPVTVRLKCS